MSLSVCLLTRNEEEHIAAALRSVAGVADEVLVADTGSRDRTAQIAAEMGARVLNFTWQDDFAAGRNFMLSYAREKWVLWLNAEETLLESSQAALRECLTRGDVFGYFVHIEQPIDELHFAETADLRLFRRRDDLRFVGRLQPEVADDVVLALQREGQVVMPSRVVLRSSVSTRGHNESKLRWTQRLLELELQDRPGELRYLIEYGGTLLMLNDPRGHSVMAEAAQQVHAARSNPAAPTLKVQNLLEYLLSAPAHVAPSRPTRDEAFELALRWFPSSPALLFKCAEIAFHRSNFPLARQILERLLDLGRTGSYDRSRRFDPGILGADTIVNLGACCERLGDLAKAEECYRRLLTSGQFATQASQGLKRMGRKP
jgi:hypothetical protein